MTKFLINIGIPKLYAGDVSLALLMILTGVILIFLVKKTKLGAFSYATYASYFITSALYFDFIDGYVVRTWVFLGLSFMLHYLLFKPTVVVKLGGRGTVMKWLRRILVAFFIVGFMVMIILEWMPNKEVAKVLSPFAIKIFTTEIAQLFWAVAPIVILFSLRKRDN